jgi:hypothetical protein
VDLNIARAQQKAALAKDAAADIEQAGRALGVVMEHCKSNTVDVKTAQIMTVAVAYINNALTNVLEHVAGDQIVESTHPSNALILPGGP